MTIKKFIIVLFIFCLLCSCTSEENENKPDELSYDTVILHVGDISVTYDIYRYYYLSLSVNYDLSDKADEAELKSECEKAVKYFSSVFIYAENNGVTIDDELCSRADAEISAYIALYGTDGVARLLSALNHTENSYKQLLIWQALFEKCMSTLDVKEEKLNAELDKLTESLEIDFDISYDLLNSETIK